MDIGAFWAAATGLGLVTAYLAGRVSHRGELKRNAKLIACLVGEVRKLTTTAVISKVAERGGRGEGAAAVRALGRTLVQSPEAPRREEEVSTPAPQSVVVRSGMK